MPDPLILPSPEIWHRNDFSVLCNWRRLWRAVEVGVDRGEFACMFLDLWQGHEWWGIDDYEPYPEMDYCRQADYLTAVSRIEKHARRAKLIRSDSARASRLFKKASIDFIYIDGAHDYEHVKADINAWYPKLTPQGILAGHDWTDQPLHEGVKRAVKEFAAEHGHAVYITTVEGYNAEACPSWYIYKMGMPGSDWKRC